MNDVRDRIVRVRGPRDAWTLCFLLRRGDRTCDVTDADGLDECLRGEWRHVAEVHTRDVQVVDWPERAR